MKFSPIVLLCLLSWAPVAVFAQTTAPDAPPVNYWLDTIPVIQLTNEEKTTFHNVDIVEVTQEGVVINHAEGQNVLVPLEIFPIDFQDLWQKVMEEAISQEIRTTPTFHMTGENAEASYQTRFGSKLERPGWDKLAAMLIERSQAISNLNFKDMSKVEEQGGIVIQIDNIQDMTPEEHEAKLNRLRYLKEQALLTKFRRQIKPIYEEIMQADGISRSQLEVIIVDMKLLVDYYYLYGEKPAQHFAAVF